jgi:hypothetical protein
VKHVEVWFRAAAALSLCFVACKSDDADSGSQRSGVKADKDAQVEAVLPRFSFFVTSLKGMQELSGSQNGFGGDLRFGETGDGAGLRGADKICSTLAERSMPGAGAKTWRAFLSATRGGEGGGPVHAADRIGEGPWFDRLGRLLAENKTDLIMQRPANADPEIKNDFPNEDGVPNHNPDGTGEVDNHDFLTGSNAMGQLYRDDPRVTCDDWTKSEPDPEDAPRVGHSWPRGFPPGGFGGFGTRDDDRDGGAEDGGAERPRRMRGPFGGGGDGGPGFSGDFDLAHWISSLDESGCGAGVSIVEMGPPNPNIPTVGSGGGYGGIYCFATTP